MNINITLAFIFGSILIAIFVLKNFYRFVRIRPNGYFSKITLNSISFKGKLNIMAITLEPGQHVVGTLAFLDKDGDPTDAASVEVSSSDTSIATATYDDPSNEVTVTSLKAGVATLKITPKNRAGEVLLFEDTAIEVVGGDATSGSIVWSVPIEN